MEINVTQEGPKTEFAIEGRLDISTSLQLESFVNDLYDKGVTDIVVDMASCDYVSSAGLRVIVTMQKHAMAGGSLVFVNVTDNVMEVFKMTGFDKIIAIV